MNKKYTFGPVISRRLGSSLGIDLVPRKKCNLDCLYCEVCPTDKHDENRISYVNIKKLVEEIKAIDVEIDYLTLTGSGEPTLHKNLDKIIVALKGEFNFPVVMLTNSLLLRKKEVRKELLGLDLIVPSLDAVSQEVFEKLNRPVPGIQADDVVKGLVEFRKIFPGKIWLEILFVKGINDNKEEISLLANAIKEIQPDRVQLNTVARPPAYGGVMPLSLLELENIASNLSYKDVDIIGIKYNSSLGKKITINAVLDYLRRRPTVFEELLTVFGIEPKELRVVLANLEKENKIIKEVYNGMVFFRINH